VDDENTSALIATRVQAGAAWLDARQPGWVDRIDLNQLDMVLAHQCILGQLYDGYRTVVRYDGFGSATDEGDTRELTDSDMIPLGLYTADAFGDDYPALTTAWAALITARRAAAQPADENPQESA
jgi:hypothetical protein